MLKLLSAAVALGMLLIPPASAVPTSTHDYQFAGTLADANGGPALKAIAGGTLGTAAAPGFRFGANDGLQLAGGVTPGGPWSIELLFDYDTQGNYEKIIDFSNLTSDSGLYTTYDKLSLYPVIVAPTPQLTSGVLADLVLTRSAAGTLNAYVNGTLSFTYDDSRYGITASSNPLTFFADDATTRGREAAPGVVQRIRTYDAVLSSTDIQALATAPSPSPIALLEPGTIALICAGLVAAAVMRVIIALVQATRAVVPRPARAARRGV